MTGASNRIEREIEIGLAQAHAMANFNAATKTKAGLKPLKHYLSKSKAQTPDDMVNMLKALGAGSDMKIRRIANDREK